MLIYLHASYSLSFHPPYLSLQEHTHTRWVPAAWQPLVSRTQLVRRPAHSQQVSVRHARLDADSALQAQPFGSERLISCFFFLSSLYLLWLCRIHWVFGAFHKCTPRGCERNVKVLASKENPSLLSPSFLSSVLPFWLPYFQGMECWCNGIVGTGGRRVALTALHPPLIPPCLLSYVLPFPVLVVQKGSDIPPPPTCGWLVCFLIGAACSGQIELASQLKGSRCPGSPRMMRRRGDWHLKKPHYASLQQPGQKQ